MISIKELKMKHQYGALIHNELTAFANDADIDIRIEAKKLAKELGYAIMPDNWNTIKVYPTRSTVKALAKLV